jgi:hypothetical protein
MDMCIGTDGFFKSALIFSPCLQRNVATKEDIAKHCVPPFSQNYFPGSLGCRSRK